MDLHSTMKYQQNDGHRGFFEPDTGISNITMQKQSSPEQIVETVTT